MRASRFKETTMKNKKPPHWVAFLAGFSVSVIFDFFWAYIYPKMGVEWNIYTRYAIELTFLFVVIIVIALFYKKREKSQAEEANNAA